MSAMSTKSLSCLIKTIRQNIISYFADFILQYISNIQGVFSVTKSRTNLEAAQYNKHEKEKNQKREK